MSHLTKIVLISLLFAPSTTLAECPCDAHCSSHEVIIPTGTTETFSVYCQQGQVAALVGFQFRSTTYQDLVPDTFSVSTGSSSGYYYESGSVMCASHLATVGDERGLKVTVACRNFFMDCHINYRIDFECQQQDKALTLAQETPKPQAKDGVIEGELAYVSSDSGCTSEVLCASGIDDYCCAAVCAEAGYYVTQTDSVIELRSRGNLEIPACSCYDGSGVVDSFGASGTFGDEYAFLATVASSSRINVEVGIDGFSCTALYRVVDGEVLDEPASSGALGFGASMWLALFSLSLSWLSMN